MSGFEKFVALLSSGLMALGGAGAVRRKKIKDNGVGVVNGLNRRENRNKDVNVKRNVDRGASGLPVDKKIRTLDRNKRKRLAKVNNQRNDHGYVLTSEEKKAVDRLLKKLPDVVKQKFSDKLGRISEYVEKSKGSLFIRKDFWRRFFSEFYSKEMIEIVESREFLDFLSRFDPDSPFARGWFERFKHDGRMPAFGEFSKNLNLLKDGEKLKKFISDARNGKFWDNFGFVLMMCICVVFSMWGFVDNECAPMYFILGGGFALIVALINHFFSDRVCAYGAYNEILSRLLDDGRNSKRAN